MQKLSSIFLEGGGVLCDFITPGGELINLLQGLYGSCWFLDCDTTGIFKSITGHQTIMIGVLVDFMSS